MELEVAHTYKEALLCVFDLMRKKRSVDNLRKRRCRILHNRSECKHFLSCSIFERYCELVLLDCRVNIHSRNNWRRRGNGRGLLVEDFVSFLQQEGNLAEPLGSVSSHENFAWGSHLHIDCSTTVTGLHSANIADTVPVLAELLCLIWEVPVVVRLVVRECTYHKLAVVS